MITLKFQEHACQRKVQGAIFAPEQAAFKNHTQFIPLDVIDYTLSDKPFDKALERRLMKLESKYIISTSDMRMAMAKHFTPD